MSATRKPAQSGPQNNYATPAWATRIIIPYLRTYLPVNPSILEPAAGNGSMVRALQPLAGSSGIDCYEIMPQCEEALRSIPHAGFVCIDNFLASSPYSTHQLYDLVITNPPFHLAFEFVKHALGWTKDACKYGEEGTAGGVVAMLLRNSFVEGEERNDWLRLHEPDKYEFSRRISFDEPHPRLCKNGRRHVWGRVSKKDRETCVACDVVKAGSDSAGYAWYVWRKYERDTGVRMTLPYVPLAETKY